MEHCATLKKDSVVSLFSPLPHDLCIFIGRTDAEAEAPILWPPDGKSLLI